MRPVRLGSWSLDWLAMKSGGLALLELRTDPDAISTRTAIASLRKRALAS